MRPVRSLVVFGLVVCAGCADTYSPLSFTVVDDVIIANGDIDSDVLVRFEEVVAEHPNADTLVLQNISGSVDDEANTEFSRFVRNMDFATRVPANGMVASGGTDLFLAGTKRVVEAGACLGVHEWAAGDFVATDLPRSDPEHTRYLDYYRDMGIDPAFYWFTLEAATADEMHWMTVEEVRRYGLATRRVASLGSGSTCDNR